MKNGAGVILVLFAVGCATLPAQPRVIALDEIRGLPVARAAWITDYERALISIAAVTERDLGLPALRAVLRFYPDRNALRAALEAEGQDPILARDTAATMAAIGGFRSILLNDAALEPLNWPSRIALLAHELAHTVQYEFSGGRRGTSDQWLREGFADWVQAHVLAALGVTTRDVVRADSIRRLRASRDPQRLPALSDMVTFPDWVALHGGTGKEFLYAHAFVAADFLIERHGLDAVTGYFRLFATSDDRTRNFAAAFGEDFATFDVAFRAHLTGLSR